MLACLVLLFLSYSCENKIEKIPDASIQSLPTLSGKNFRSEIRDSGKLQVIMYAKTAEQYKNVSDPYSEFTSGIRVVFYDGKKDSVGTVTSKYAKYTESNNTWELRDSVVVINEIGDMLETEILFWDQRKDLIHTDRFVKITSEDQIINGYGFQSDSHLNNRKIKKVRAIIYIPDEK